MPKILKYVPPGVRIIPQSEFVAESLQRYFKHHPDMERRCSKGGTARYLTTENSDKFKDSARTFLREDISVQHVDLD